MQYDPIQAFLSGITSTFFRIIFVFISFLLALSIYIIWQKDADIWTVFLFPFVTFGTIFAWAATGLPFFIGLFSLIAFLFFAWRFIDTSDPKSMFFLLVGLATIYFIPFTWTRDYALWKMLSAATVFYVCYFCFGYLFPAIARYYFGATQT